MVIFRSLSVFVVLIGVDENQIAKEQPLSPVTALFFNALNVEILLCHRFKKKRT